MGRKAEQTHERKNVWSFRVYSSELILLEYEKTGCDKWGKMAIKIMIKKWDHFLEVLSHTKEPGIYSLKSKWELSSEFT